MFRAVAQSLSLVPFVAAALSAVACAERPTAPPPSPGGITAPVPTGGHAPGGPPAGSTASVAAASAATPGTIACEALACDGASEVCCLYEAEVGRPTACCLPAGPPGGAGPCEQHQIAQCKGAGLITERRCDEHADCPTGQRCCEWSRGEWYVTPQRCEEACLEEVCLRGTTCPSGAACAVADGERVGNCPLQREPPVCAGERCAAGERCCWDAANQRGSCASECPPDAVTLRCTSRSQCAPYDCNSRGDVADYRCGGDDFHASVLCDTPADCPDQLQWYGYGDYAPHLAGCRPSERLPPDLKECAYE